MPGGYVVSGGRLSTVLLCEGGLLSQYTAGKEWCWGGVGSPLFLQWPPLVPLPSLTCRIPRLDVLGDLVLTCS